MRQQSSLEFLFNLGEKTRHLTEPVEIMAAVSAELGQHLKTSRCAYADVEADTNHFTIHRDYASGARSVAGKYQLSDFGVDAPAVVRRGETLVLHDVGKELAGDPGREGFRHMDTEAMICCPLIKHGKLVAMMAVQHVVPRRWQEHEVALVQEVVERCWAFIERARAESLAQRREQQFHQLLEFSPDAIALVDESGKVTLTNTRFDNLFGYGRSELENSSIYRLLPGLMPLLEKNSEIQPEQDTTAQPLAIQRAGGEQVEVEVLQNPIQSETGMLYVLSVRDVSERVRMEAELRQSKKMETVGMLAGGVAHDFNNLLTVIVNTAELELIGASALSADTESSLRAIREAGISAGKLTQQLLALSRQQVLEPMVLNINGLLERLRPMMQSLLGENVALEITREQGLANVKLDQNQFEQVILNLVVNARDAIRGKGTVKVVTENEVSSGLGVSDTGNAGQTHGVWLRVSDNGEGMTSEQVDQVFEPFYTTKEKQRGTGLGLATVYGIVKQSGGEIRVESEPGIGSTFSLRFPATLEREAPQHVAKTPTGRQKNARILVVEDESALRASLVGILKASHYEVADADCGEAAIDLLDQADSGFDVIICDVIMPGLSGPEVVKHARRSHPEIKIILTSGYVADKAEAPFEIAGEYSFVSKPYSAHELRALVARVI